MKTREEAKADAANKSGAVKTVKLPDGKDYKDGDIYTDPKTGQQSRVRVH